MNIILVGIPGAGKGTQAQKICSHYKIDHISTGNIFREITKDSSELGKKIFKILQAGELVSDEITDLIVEEKLQKENYLNGFLIDGYPRNLNQAQAFDKICNKLNLKIDFVININVSEEILIERLSGRRVCPQCQSNYHIITNPPKVENICDKCNTSLYQRDDDNIESIKNRLVIFYQKTQPIIDYYQDMNLVCQIDGNDSIENVFNQIKKAIDRKVKIN